MTSIDRRQPVATLSRAVAAAACLVCVAVASGWLTAALSGTALRLNTPFGPGRAVAGTVGGDAWYIARWNLQVALTIVAGVGTLGIFSVVALAWNGFRLGFGLASIARSCPGLLTFMAAYLPLEFSSLAVVTGATVSIVINAVRAAASGGALDVRSHACALAAAAALLVAAAFVEAYARHAVSGFVRCP